MSEAKMMDERRYKLLMVDPGLILQMLNWCTCPVGFYAIPITDDLPEGCVVRSVHTCWSSNSIQLLVEHASFSPVPRNCEPPRIRLDDCRVFHRADGKKALLDFPAE